MSILLLYQIVIQVRPHSNEVYNMRNSKSLSRKHEITKARKKDFYFHIHTLPIATIAYFLIHYFSLRL